MAGKRARPVAGTEQQIQQNGLGPQPSAHPGLLALHRSRLFDWSPSPITAMSACPAHPLVAIGFSSGDLELWDLQLTACLQRVVGRGVEVTALAWARDSLDGSWRAFCASLDGVLSEVAWQQGRLVAALDSGAGTIWSLAARPVEAVRAGFGHSLAAACDDGSVRLFSVEGGEPGAIFERRLAQLQGRALSVAWHPAGGALVAGGVDGCVHALDPTTGQESMRISVGAQTTGKPVCVWRLLVLADGTLVSGDSDGAVQFWDGKFGALLQRFTIHAADVLALAAAPDGSAVFAAGMDSQVAQFQRCSSAASGGSGLLGTMLDDSASHAHGTIAQASNQWVYSHFKRPHSHDVRAMDIVKLGGGRAVLLSGGLDAQLIAYPVSSFLKEHPVRLTKCPQRPICAVTVQQQAGSGAGRLLSAQHEAVNVWQLGCASLHGGESLQGWQPGVARTGVAGGVNVQSGSSSPGVEGDVLDLTASPRHLAQIQCGGRVGVAVLSPCGQFVACAVGANSTLRVYVVREGVVPSSAVSGGAVVSRMRATAPCASVAALVFLGSTHLLAALHSGAVRLYSLPHSGQAEGSKGRSEDEGQLELVAELGGGEMAPADGAATTSAAAARGLKGPVAAAKAAAKVVGLSGSKSEAWRMLAPAVSCVAASSAGDLAAVAGPSDVTILRANLYPTPAHAAPLLEVVGKQFHAAQDAPFTCLAFSADGALLAATQASGHLTVWDVAAGRPNTWGLEQGAAVTACLERLPGTPQGVAFSPVAGSKHLLVHTAGGFCSLDVSAPVDPAALQRSKRRRGSAKPAAQGPTSTPGAGPLTDAAAGRLKAASSSGPAGAQAGGQGAVLGQGANGRVVLLQDPLVFLGFTGPGEVVLLEKPWADVVGGMALPPLQRHRYGA